MPKYIAISVAACVLLGALALQVMRFRNSRLGETSREAHPVDLAERIPLSVPGWLGRDEPLGPTEFVQSEVKKTLNYDDCVNRVYTNGSRTFGVYAAYWSPGRMPVQKVASHTPDRCWTENGWKCVKMRFPDNVSCGGVNLRPAYWRIFSPPGDASGREYVIYWHLVGGDLYDYGGGFNQRLNPFKWWRDTLHYALKGSAEQYFVRVTSNQPFTGLEDDPGFARIVAALGKLGLGEKAGELKTESGGTE